MIGWIAFGIFAALLLLICAGADEQYIKESRFWEKELEDAKRDAERFPPNDRT